MIVALGAAVDVGIVFIGKCIRGGEEIIIGRCHRVEKLMWISGLAMRLVTVDALDPQIGVSDRQRLALEQAPARGP